MSNYFLRVVDDNAEAAPLGCAKVDPHHADWVCVAERDAAGSLRYYDISNASASVSRRFRFCVADEDQEEGVETHAAVSASKQQRRIVSFEFVPGIPGEVLFCVEQSRCVFRSNVLYATRIGEEVDCVPVGWNNDGHVTCFSSLYDGDHLYIATGNEAGALHLWRAGRGSSSSSSSTTSSPSSSSSSSAEEEDSDRLVLSVLKAHDGRITSVELMSDMVFTGGYDERVNIWKIDGELLAKLDVPTAEISTLVTFAVPDDKEHDTLDLMGVGTVEGNVYIFDLFRLSLHMLLESDEDNGVVSLCASHDGRALATSYCNGTLCFSRTSSEPHNFASLGKRVICRAPLSCAYHYSPSRVGQFVVWQQQSGETMVWNDLVLPDQKQQRKSSNGRGTVSASKQQQQQQQQETINNSYVDSSFSEMDDSTANDESSLPQPTPYPNSNSSRRKQTSTKTKKKKKSKQTASLLSEEEEERKAPIHLRNPAKLYDILKDQLTPKEEVEPSSLAHPSYNFTRRLMQTIDKTVQEQIDNGVNERAIEKETERRYQELLKLGNPAQEELAFALSESKYDALPSVDVPKDAFPKTTVKKQVSRKWLASLKHKPNINDLRESRYRPSRYTPPLPKADDLMTSASSSSARQSLDLWNFPQPQPSLSPFYYSPPTL